MPPASAPPTASLTAALVELVNLMLDVPTVEAMLDDMARLAARVVTPPAACGITMRRNRHVLTVAASAPLAGRLDEVQYGQDDGPCLQALRTGVAVHVHDLAMDTRWGSYRLYALGAGVRSSLSLPLVVDGKTQGALNLYALTPNAFGDTARAAAEQFAAQASAALTIVSRQARQTQLSEQLKESLASRSVIDRAIGIVMAQRRCAADTAFELLRELSQNQNRKLRDVASDLVSATSGEPPGRPPFNHPE
jgi:GAF domain-containing protein